MSSLRIPGVLQRFGLSYFFVASFRLISCTLYQRIYAGTEDDNPPNRVSKRKKLLIYLPEIFLYIICIIIYGWATLFWKYSETCPPGYQGPGGLHKESSYFNCTGGAANFIGKWIEVTQNKYVNIYVANFLPLLTTNYLSHVSVKNCVIHRSYNFGTRSHV